MHFFVTMIQANLIIQNVCFPWWNLIRILSNFFFMKWNVISYCIGIQYAQLYSEWIQLRVCGCLLLKQKRKIFQFKWILWIQIKLDKEICDIGINSTLKWRLFYDKSFSWSWKWVKTYNEINKCVVYPKSFSFFIIFARIYWKWTSIPLPIIVKLI